MNGTNNAPGAGKAPGLDFSRFGSMFGNIGDALGNAPSTGAGTGAQKRKAKIWLNFGYNRPVTDAQGQPSSVFVSLPFGIPVDTQDMKELKGSDNMLQLRKWQNELLEDVIKIGDSLEPGEERILAFDATNHLAIQIRHVRSEASADTIDSGERFVLRCHGDTANAGVGASADEQVTEDA